MQVPSTDILWIRNFSTKNFSTKTGKTGLFNYISWSWYCQNQVRFGKLCLSYMYVCLLASEVSLQLKSFLKNVYKCREDETDTIVQVYHAECFNAVEIDHACLRRPFKCGRVYLYFTYNDIVIC